MAAPFADHHREFWQWVWSLTPGERPAPFVAIWPRGGAKSTSAELACVALATRQTRRYVLYVSATQQQADDHVQNVASLLESATFSAAYPSVASRSLNKYGASQGWRRNRLRTQSGFTIDAIGLDTAARGAKIEEDRPDLIILDDLDGELDTDATTQKKIAILTRKLLPAGSSDLAVLGIQNLVHPDSVFSRLADGRADFLANRIVSGPIPALTDFQHREEQGRTWIAGEPTWEGQSLATCQALLDDIGLEAFQAECQQDVSVLREQIFDVPAWWGEGRHRFHLQEREPAGTVAGVYLMFDTALKDGETNDYTACTAWELLASGRIRVRHQWKRRLQFPQLVDAIEATAQHYYQQRQLIGGQPLLRRVVIEDKVSGTSAVQSLKAASKYPWLRGLIEGWPPAGSKEYRARHISIWCARGMVDLPFPEPDEPWILDLERDLVGFPNIPFKDVIDTFTMGIWYLENYLRTAWARITAPPVPEGIGR